MDRGVPPALLPSLQARLGERAAATRRAILRRLALAAGVVAVVAALAWAAFLSPLFALDPARVSVVAPEGTVDLAAVQAVTDSYAGVALPRLGSAGLADRLEDLAGVRSASVERAWPRGLLVTIEPRTAVAAVPADGGVALFDADGVNLGTVAAAPAGVLLVAVPLGEDTARTLDAVLGVLASLPEALRAEVVDVSAATADSIQFKLADGATVRWGSESESDLKAAVLATLRQLPASLYDVSTPRRPITQ